MIARIAIGAIALLLVAAGGWLGWRHYESLVASNAALAQQVAQLKQDAHDQQAALDKLQADKNADDRLLAERQRERNAMAQQTQRLHARVKAAAAEPQAQAWMAARVPAAVDQLLRDSAGPGDGDKDGDGAAAGGADRGDTGTGVVGHDQPRPAAVGAGSAPSTAIVQRGQAVAARVAGQS